MLNFNHEVNGAKHVKLSIVPILYPRDNGDQDYGLSLSRIRCSRLSRRISTKWILKHSMVPING